MAMLLSDTLFLFVQSNQASMAFCSILAIDGLAMPNSVIATPTTMKKLFVTQTTPEIIYTFDGLFVRNLLISLLAFHQ